MMLHMAYEAQAFPQPLQMTVIVTDLSIDKPSASSILIFRKWEGLDMQLPACWSPSCPFAPTARRSCRNCGRQTAF